MITTADSIKARYGDNFIAQLCPDQIGGIDIDKLNTAINNATSEIEASLAKYYQIPLDYTNIPPILNACAVDLSVEYLCTTMIPDGVAGACKSRRIFLKQLADGVITLPLKTKSGAQTPDTIIGGDLPEFKQTNYFS